VNRVLIAGVGNVLLGDDGVGPYIINLLKARYSFGPGVEVEDFGTPALDFIDNIVGREALIVIDSVANGGTPGTITLYRKADIVRITPSVRMHPHSPALVESLLAADLYGSSPAEVLLVGITGESYKAGCELSVAVQSGLDSAIAAVLAELDRLNVRYEQKSTATKIDVWWSRQRPLLS
jgi:hydrogenase maturation protease